MPELVAVIDESGKTTLEFICVIIGDNTSVNKNVVKIPTKFTHMTNMPENEKLPLLRSFDFTGNIYVCCINIGLKELESTIDGYIRRKKNNKNKNWFRATVGYELELTLRNEFDIFTRSNDWDLKQLEFEVDNSELSGYLKSAGFKTKTKTRAHELADCVAHANFKNWPLDNIRELNNGFKLEFHNRVMSTIKSET